MGQAIRTLDVSAGARRGSSDQNKSHDDNQGPEQTSGLHRRCLSEPGGGRHGRGQKQSHPPGGGNAHATPNTVGLELW